MGVAMDQARRVLIVDDSEVDREHIRRLLGSGFAVLEASTAHQGLDVCQMVSVDCVLLDYRLPDRDGIELLDEFVDQELPVLMLTGQGSESIAVEAMKRGALDYLVKGQLASKELRRSVENALEKISLRRQVSRQQAELHAFVAALDAQRAELECSNQKLAESESRLRVVLEQLPGLTWTTDPELKCTSLAGARTPYEPRTAVGSSIERLFEDSKNAELVTAHERALERRPGRFEMKLRGRTYDAHVEPLRTNGVVEGVIGVALDVTEARSLELQLRHSQKMDAMGKLAGGVAHDFNNILTAIVSFAGFVKEELPPEAPAYEDIEEVLRASSRAEALVRQLLAFSRRRPAEPRPVDVAGLVATLGPMLRRLVDEDVALELLCTDTEGHVALVDPGGLEQVVVNLVVNARDAMPRGGRISVETARIAFDEATGSGPRRILPAGDYVQLSVSDTGEGIPHEVQERIFEPFFTTKGPGKGTGLGLSTCYGIVRQAGGRILVYSEPSHGTTFKVYLPSCSQGARKLRRRPRGKAIGGSETVLVVEDDPQVRAGAARILSRLGYRVLKASDVAGAAELASEASPDSLALVLTDFVMPDGTGADVVDKIRARHPGIAVLYMSGYTGGALKNRDLVREDAEVLHKPFTAAQLTRVVRRALDRHKCRPGTGSPAE